MIGCVCLLVNLGRWLVGWLVHSFVTRWEAPGGFGASSGLWLANFSFSTLMLLVGSFDL